MPIPKCLKKLSCIPMDFEEGDTIEDGYDFAEDAYDFESQLAHAKDIEFTEYLDNTLTKGSLVTITGTPSEDIPWFAINLGLGPIATSKSDVAVHFNVRLPQCYVVRNTKRNEKWGNEETSSFRRFPFKPGRAFTIEVLIDDKETLWAVDGVHYCSYTHRPPVSPFQATWLQVVGIRDVAFNVKLTDHYPTLAPPLIKVPTKTSYDCPRTADEPEWHPNVVASTPLSIPEGYQLVAHGRLRPLLHSFQINIMQGTWEWPRSDIHLHVDIRAHVQAQLSRQLVVLNTYSARTGGWGSERRQRTARLIPATEVTFRIVRASEEWQVFVDNLLIGEYRIQKHTVLSTIDIGGIRIRGDFYPIRIYICPTNYPSTLTSVTSEDQAVEYDC